MTNNYLSQKAIHVLETMSKDQRAMYALEDQWIPYPAASEILDELELLLNRPKRNRSVGMALFSESNNGKTEILKQFIERNQKERFSDRVNVRILDIEAPPVPSLTQLYSKILSRIGDPKAEAGTAGVKLERLILLLRRLEVECLVIDELNNVHVGTPAQRKAFLNMLKHLSNALKVPVIVAGTEEVKEVIMAHYQVHSRYPLRCVPKWNPDEGFLEFLVRLEAILPLRETSKIWEMADHLYGLSGGIIGNVVTLVRQAAYIAIMAGRERISLNELTAAEKFIVSPY